MAVMMRAEIIEANAGEYIIPPHYFLLLFAELYVYVERRTTRRVKGGKSKGGRLFSIIGFGP